MADFNIGDTVRNIFTGQTGKVEFVHAARRGLQLYRVFYSMDSVKDEKEDDLERAVQIRDLFDRCAIGAFNGYSDFQLYNTTYKIDNSSNNTLSSIKASKTLFKTYQYIPLMKFLTSDVRRLLIADEVGLGKTIEAGHIMLELKARGELKNVLVVCPKALTNKWQGELEERFGMNFVIYKDKNAMKQDIKGHNGNARGIITYESISDRRGRSRVSKEKREEERKKERETQEKSVLYFLEQNNIRYSLVVCDEAHHVRNENTSRRASIDRLLHCADAALFLTATPVMLGRRNLFSLLNLLNSQRYSFQESFENEMKHVEPIVWAVRALNANMSFDEIKKGLDDQMPENDYIRDLAGFSRLVEHLKLPETPKTRTMVQSDLYDINPLSAIMSRTRKVDVTTDLSQATRDTRTIKVRLYPEEQEMFDEYMEDFEDLDPLAVTTRRRQIASSVYGFEYGYAHFEDSLPDAKFDSLMEILSECQNKGNGKAIVFVGFKNTLYYLAKRLDNKGVGYRAISGDDKTREERVQAVEDFRTRNDIQVLLSTEVGGEGLDMQFCNTLVNYDLPWNPMVVEQRIGRIDRIGQQSEVIHIYTMLVEGSIQTEIYDRLLTRIETFRQTIGDLEAILDEGIVEKIEELYRTKMTRAELEEKMKRIDRAIERNLEDSKRLEQELSGSFTSDSYLRDHLNKIIRNNAYVTEQELENYVRCLFREELPTCSIGPLQDGLATISVPRNNIKALTNFLYKFNNLTGERAQVMNDFINMMRDRERLVVTFDQEVAEKNRNIVFLNIYHPLVIAAKETFYKSRDNLGGVFRFQLKMGEVKDAHRGYYMQAIYDVGTEYQRFGSKRNVNEVHSVVYDLQQHDVINLADDFYGAVQSYGHVWESNDVFRMDESDIEDIRVCMNRAMGDFCDEYRHNVVMRQKDDIRQQQQGQNARYDFLIRQLKEIIEDNESRIEECNRQIFDGMGDSPCMWDYEREPAKKRTYAKAKEEFLQVRPAMQGRLKSLEEEYSSRTLELESVPDPIVSSKIIMLNLIHVV